MAGLPVAPAVPPVYDPRGPDDVEVNVRALNPQRNTFWIRQIMIDAPRGRYVSLDSIRRALPFLRDLLETQLPFMVKVIMHYSLSEEVFDPETGARNVVYSERRTATVPMLVRPLANPEERLRRYIIAGAERTIQDRLEHARFHNSTQKFEGFLSLQIFTSPSREMAQLPAAPGRDFRGGCWLELPSHLRSGNKGLWSPKNSDHQCFRYCVMAHLLGCADWSIDDRKHAAGRLGRPFFNNPANRPGKRRGEKAFVDVFVEHTAIDFSCLPQSSPVTFQDIEKFEESNAGLVEVFVYRWSSLSWVNEEYYYLMPVRSPSREEPAKATVLLLLHENHFVLIYDLNRLSSVRSCQFAASQRNVNHHSWNRCPRCMCNFHSQAALAKHVAGRVCSEEPGKRKPRPLEMPAEGEDRLYYRAKDSAAMHPCVVYADFEVFNALTPSQIDDQRVVSKQHRVASFAYMAVGRSGFEIPEAHRIKLQRADEDSGEFGIVEFLLRCLLDLANAYRKWCKETNKPCVMTDAEQMRHREALVCDICGSTFDEDRRKVCHHEHGSGRYLATACNACNLGIRLPRQVVVYLHNGGAYDFHYLLRFLAHEKGYENHDEYISGLLRQNVAGEVEEEESGVVEEPRGEEGWDAWSCDLSKISLEALVKSGEKCLTIRFGPLCFVDSINVFPTGLGALIEDNRASCASGDLAQVFPLLAERHPFFAAAQRQAHPYFAALQKRVPEWRSTAWKLLLKKIPMAFDVLSGPECWGWPALLPQEAYDSVLTGEKCSAEKYAEVKEIVEFFGFQTFADFHDAYLYTDLALADIMEHYRDTFFENFKLDPCQYVTHASASYDAMLKMCCPRVDCSLGIMKDVGIYDLLKANIRGGLGHIAQPFARANNERVSGFDEAAPSSWLLFYDINSMYPSIMEKPLPVDGGLWMELPKIKKDRLKRLNALFDVVDYNRDDEEVCYMVEVTFDVPWQRHSAVDWAPVCKMSVKKSDLSPYTQSLVAPERPVSETPKLVPYLGMHVKEAVDLRYLKFVMENLGVRVFDFTACVKFQCRAFMKPFVQHTVQTRRELKRAGRKLQAEVQKLTGNVQYGKMVQNQESFRTTRVYTDGVKFQKKAAGPKMLDIHPQIVEEHAFLAFMDVEKSGKAAVLKSFLQGGWKVLEESRLLMFKAHYKIRRVFDGHLMKSTDTVLDDEFLRPEESKVRWLGGDTDSSVIQIFDEADPKIALADSNLLGGGPFFDVGGDAKGEQLVEHLAPLKPCSRDLVLRNARAGAALRRGVGGAGA